MADKHHIDQLFQNAFEHFESSPSEEMWSAIADALLDNAFIDNLESFEEIPSGSNWEAISEQILDEKAQGAFRDFEQQPSNSVWQNIKKQLPLNLWVKDGLNRLTKIAALLLIGFLLLLLIGQSGLVDKIQDRISSKSEEPTANIDLSPSELSSKKTVITDNLSIADSEEITNSSAEENSTLIPLSIVKTTDTEGGKTVVDETSSRQLAINSDPIENSEKSLTNNSPSFQNILSVSESLEPTNLSDPHTIQNELAPSELSNESLNSNEHKTNSSASVIISDDEALAAKDNRSFKVLSNTSDRVLVSDLNAEADKILDQLSEDDYKNLGKLGESYRTHLSRTGDDLSTLKAFAFKGMYFSIYSQVNSTWVISDRIKNDISSGNEVTNVLDIGASYGAGIGKQISPYLAIELGWLNARSGQKFQEPTNSGVYRTSELNQTYNYIPLMLKYQATRLNSAGKFPLTWNYIGGIHYGRLQSAILKTGNEGASFTETLVQNELGFDLGMEFHLFIDPKFFLSVGGHASYGIEAARFTGHGANSASNMNIGLQMGIHYRLLR